MLGHWVDLDPYFLHRERVLRLIRTDRAAEQLARWDPHRALTPSSPAHLATALGLALPALDTAELPRLVYEHGMAVGRLVGIEQTFCFRLTEGGMQSTDPRIAFEGREHGRLGDGQRQSQHPADRQRERGPAPGRSPARLPDRRGHPPGRGQDRAEPGVRGPAVLHRRRRGPLLPGQPAAAHAAEPAGPVRRGRLPQPGERRRDGGPADDARGHRPRRAGRDPGHHADPQRLVPGTVQHVPGLAPGPGRRPATACGSSPALARAGR